jgi:hypothetical protein
MGLLRMLAFPVTLPMWVARVSRDEAERQLYDVGAIGQQLSELERQHRAGEVDDETFAVIEEDLLGRWMDAREYHRRKEQEAEG